MGARTAVLSIVFVILGLPAGLFGEPLILINRTGFAVELIQSAPAGAGIWGDDLIPSRLLPDGESAVLDLPGPPPWSLRLVDVRGTVYVVYEAVPGTSGKLSVGPEHQAEISRIAGTLRRITIANRTGSAVTSVRISPVNDQSWGADILSGKTIRDGETAELKLETDEGVLTYDVRFTLLSGGQEIQYVRNDVILTDGASLVLNVR